jgi:hypothetical protein
VQGKFGNVPALKRESTEIGDERSTQHIEQGAFTRAVGTDDALGLEWRYRDRDVIYSDNVKFCLTIFG